MPITSPSELIPFLESLGLSPKKGLSQNFLIDGNIVRKIASLADLKPGDRVIEVGPGPGALTEELLSQGAFVLAVEADRSYAKALERFQTEDRRLQVIQGDFLQQDLKELLTPGDGKWKMLANLPYHLTSPILTKIAPLHEQMACAVCMIQDEVARRCAAPAGSKTYGSLSVFLQFFAELKYGHKVSRKCFYPAPNVDSALLVMDLKAPPEGIDPAAFEAFVRTAFSQRRKMLRGALSPLFESAAITKALTDLTLNPQARAEDLSLASFLALFTALQ